jgi:hypothetical protein
MYITGAGSECHRAPNHKTHAGEIMRSSFMPKRNNVVGNALVCKLQRKQLHESTEISKDTSNVAHLLVIWRIYKYRRLYADVLLIECNKVFDWNKNNLDELCRKNANRFELSLFSITKTWSLDDNAALMTTFKTMNEDHILDITISEVERNSDMRIPPYIDLRR